MHKTNNMVKSVTIDMVRPITSATIFDADSSVAELTQQNGQVAGGQVLEEHKTIFSQTVQMLQSVIDKLNHINEQAINEHKEEIAKLSVEIARKILVQKVKDGDYEIESIIKETLTHAPFQQDVVVHLNPEDLAQYNKLQQDVGSEALKGINLVADPNIAPAQCMLDTPKGVIQSFIDEQLEQIGKALGKAE
ncbi:FliH/SctL family protein [Planctomycetota bacterium]